MKARIKFRKYGVMKYIGHLDVMRYFQKAIRRAEIPIAFTGGYSPHMIMSFAQPLGVGVTSDGEYFDIELTEPVDRQKALSQMNAVMIEGIEVVDFTKIPDDKKYSGMTIVAAAEYRVTFSQSFSELERKKEMPKKWKEQLKGFLSQPQIVVLKKTKRSEKEVDIKPMIYRMEAEGDEVRLFLAAGSEQNLKPDLVMDAFLKYAGEKPEEVPRHYHRIDVYAKDERFAEGGAAYEKRAGFKPLNALEYEVAEHE